MQRLLLVALIGFAAQLIDGSMGMAYGVTASSLLLLAGFAPATASASLHMAEVATTIASGAAHSQLGNVNRHFVRALALPGAVGGFIGAIFLTSLPADLVRPVVSGLLFLLGLSILLRFARGRQETAKRTPLRRRFLAPLGLVAGLCDAIGGGGWGPIVTSTMLAKSDAEPRTVVGSVAMSEAAVAVAATLGFLLSMGWSAFQFQWVLSLMTGGVLAAPVAAWLVKRVPKHVLGVLIGGVILFTHTPSLARLAGAGPMLSIGLYVAVTGLWVYAFLRTLARRETPPPPAMVIPQRQVQVAREQAERRVANAD